MRVKKICENVNEKVRRFVSKRLAENENAEEEHHSWTLVQDAQVEKATRILGETIASIERLNHNSNSKENIAPTEQILKLARSVQQELKRLQREREFRDKTRVLEDNALAELQAKLSSGEYIEYCSRVGMEPVRIHSTLREILFVHYRAGALWHYQDCIYAVTNLESEEKIKLLIFQEADKEREKFEYLKRKFASDASREITFGRVGIPEEVRIAVWRRDQGKCVKCESRENLEYDHIIPVSKGGSNTVRNIELLCEACNRRKGGKVQ